VYRASLDGLAVLLVWVTTDGTDGWLEIYEEEGGLVAAGRYMDTEVTWGTLPQVRAHVEEGG
jgi:hypothetical protein